MPVRLSMRRQCRAICVKRAIYFSRSWRERPQRNFGREESEPVSLQRKSRRRSPLPPAPAADGRRADRPRYLLPGAPPPRRDCRLMSVTTAGAGGAARRGVPTPSTDNAIICTKGKFEMPLTHRHIYLRRSIYPSFAFHSHRIQQQTFHYNATLNFGHFLQPTTTVNFRQRKLFFRFLP